MKEIAHLFSREVVSRLLNSKEGTKSIHFEFMAALLMQRVCEKLWNIPTMIGYYIKKEWADKLQSEKEPSEALQMAAIDNGLEGDHPVDFIIAGAEAGGIKFQLKRYGFGNQVVSTDDLITYLRSLKEKYSSTGADLLLGVTEFDKFDYPKLRIAITPGTIPFEGLHIIGIVADEFFIAQIFPQEGWSKYHLSELM
jgi:hypothetical protein